MLRFLSQRVSKPLCPVTKCVAASKRKGYLREGCALPHSGSGVKSTHSPHVLNKVRASAQQKKRAKRKKQVQGKKMDTARWGLASATCVRPRQGLTPPLPQTQTAPRIPRHHCDSSAAADCSAGEPYADQAILTPRRKWSAQRGCHNRKETNASLHEAPVSPTLISPFLSYPPSLYDKLILKCYKVLGALGGSTGRASESSFWLRSRARGP